MKKTIYIEKIAEKTKPNLYVIALGVSEFKESQYNLKYAAKDAHDIVEQMKASKAFGNVFTKLLVNNEVTVANVTKSKSFLQHATIDDVVIVFAASHGLLDDEYEFYLAGFDTNFRKPDVRGIPYATIQDLLDGIKPLKKILLLDACHSGEIDTEEVVAMVTSKEVEVGFQTKRGSKPIAVMKKEVDALSDLNKNLFADLRRGNGATSISAAGGLEFAYESDKWNNGLFTYCILNGLTTLHADQDKDGKVGLMELQKYVAKNVRDLSGGLQVPTFRTQNLSIDYIIW